MGRPNGRALVKKENEDEGWFAALLADYPLVVG